MFEPAKDRAARVVFGTLLMLAVVSALFLVYRLVEQINSAMAENQKTLATTPMRPDAELAALYRYRITAHSVQRVEGEEMVTMVERAYTNDWMVRAVAQKTVYAPTSERAIAWAKGYELRVDVTEAVLQVESPEAKYERVSPNGISLMVSFGDSWNVKIVDTRTGEILFQEMHDHPSIVVP